MNENTVPAGPQQINPYRKCQQYELLNAMHSRPWPEESGWSCDANATESVNLPDWENMNDPSRDRIFWVCAQHFEPHYHSYIIRGIDGQCDCAVCQAQ
jgi:hypothetical protein